jgi:uncharacterized membrane protein
MEAAMPRMMVVLSLAASVGLCGNALANQWSVCNRTPEDVNVAIAYHNAQTQTTVEGWRRLAACGGCAVMLNYDQIDNDTVYLFGENNAQIARFSAEHPQFCVVQQSFRNRHLPGVNCPGGAKVVGFQKVTIPDLNKTHKTDLTGSVGGKNCID